METDETHDSVGLAMVAIIGFALAYLIGFATYFSTESLALAIRLVQHFDPIASTLIVLIPNGIGGMAACLLNLNFKRSFATLFCLNLLTPAFFAYMIVANSATNSHIIDHVALLILNVIMFLIMSLITSFVIVNLRKRLAIILVTKA